MKTKTNNEAVNETITFFDKKIAYFVFGCEIFSEEQ